MNTVDKGVRLTNYLIDLIIIYVSWLMIILMMPIYKEYLLFYCLMFLYYVIMEFSWGQTLGKMVTKTKVVHKSGGKPSFVNILIRSFCRLIPIDALSYLFGSGMHDQLSSTRVIRG